MNFHGAQFLLFEPLYVLDNSLISKAKVTELVLFVFRADSWLDYYSELDIQTSRC